MPNKKTVPTRKAALSWDIWTALGLVYLIWGSTYFAIRVAIQGIPPFWMAGTRFLAAGSFLLMVLKLRGEPWPTLRQWRSASLVGFLLVTVANGGVCWVEKWVPSGITALLVATVPLWMALLEWIRPGGKRPSGVVWTGILLGLLGILVLVFLRPGAGGIVVDPWGALALIGTSLAWAVGSLYARQADLPASPLMGTAQEMLIGGLGQMGVSLLLGEPRDLDPGGFHGASLEAWVYLTLVGSLVGYSSYIWVLQRSNSALASTYAFVNPVIAVFLGHLAGGEEFSGTLFLSGGVIVVAVVLITLGARPVGKKGS